MNNVILIGRLCRDPELSYTTTGTAICKFTLAVDRPTRATEEKTADFIKVTVFNAQAENSNRYLKKGSKCAVNGRIQTGSYKDRDGRTVSTFDVVANNVEFLDSKTKEDRPAERPAFTEVNEYPPF